MMVDASFLARLLEIVWINILLSGDNAVVIALACSTLPTRQQKWGIILGTAPAVLLRIGCAVAITYLMAVPYLKLAGGLLLLWIAVDLLKEEEEKEAHIREGTTLWFAIRTIVIADLVMSLDNVLAIAAAAKGSIALLVIGLIISMPLVIFGSALLLKLINAFPMLVLAGGALLGYIAGDVAVGDSAIVSWIGPYRDILNVAVPLVCAVAVIPASHALTRIAARRRVP